MITNEQLAALWEQLRRINRKYCDIDYQREYDEMQEDLRRAYEQGENINAIKERVNDNDRP